jgi:hypothetical protein
MAFVSGGLVTQVLELFQQLPGDAGKAAGAILTLVGVIGHLVNTPNATTPPPK